MGLSTSVIINRISNLSDARYCAGMGVDYLGFNIDPLDTDFMDPNTFEAITGWVSGVKLVGEFHLSSIENIEETCKHYPLNGIQVKNEALLPEMQKYGLPLILELNLDEYQDAISLESVFESAFEMVDFFLVSGDNEQKCQGMHQSILSLAQSYPVFLSCGIDKDNVIQLVKDAAIRGIGLKGSEEIKPGYKDFDELADILELLETEED